MVYLLACDAAPASVRVGRNAMAELGAGPERLTERGVADAGGGLT